LLQALSSLFLAALVWADGGGRITGTVMDQTGAVIPGGTAVLVNTATGVSQTTTTRDDGTYTFPVVPVGDYEIDVTALGFKPYRRTGIVIDINSALTIDVTLQVGQQAQSVTVAEEAARVEATDTQLGQVIGSKQVTEIPLNGRSYTDLLVWRPI
jgi:Carboxypeptidase regulatory-like domain